MVTSAMPDPARPLGHLITVAAGLRDPVVAILLAIAFFTAISGKPVDGVLMLTVSLSLAWDSGRRGRDATARLDGPGTTGATARLDGPGTRGGPGTLDGTATAGGTTSTSGLARPESVPRVQRRPLLVSMLVAGGAAYTGVVGSFGRYSWPATVGIVGLGAVVVLLGWRGPLRRRPAGATLPRAGTAVWGGLFVAGCLWELTALLEQPTLATSSYAHPTVSTLTDPVLASSPGRWAVLAGWLALGWYLAGR